MKHENPLNISRRRLLIGAAALPLSALLSRVAVAAPYPSAAAPVQTWLGEWNDAKRNRTVPVKIYFPQGAGPFPAIVFSHGLGGTRNGYEFLGRHWAQNGFVSVHLQHLGSDDSAWKGGGGLQAMAKAANFKNALDRTKDVSFAIDQLEALSKTADFPLRGKLDLTRLGMADHSFGCNTTLLISGMKFPVPGVPNTAGPRIKAAVAMSAPSPNSKNYEAIYGSIKLPIFHMTGTKDTSPIDRPGSTALDRHLPYDNIKGAPQYLTTLQDGDHMIFSGRAAAARNTAADARFHELALQSSTAFWNAYLKDDARAKTWLATDFARELGADGKFEMK